MKLGKKTAQDLKSQTIRFEDLNDRYFINSENILKLLNENICSFKQIVDKYKRIKDAYNDPCLYVLLDREELFEKLIKNNTLNTEDLRYLLNKIDYRYELYSLCWNTTLLKYILNEFVLDKEDVDRFNRMIENNGWCKNRNIRTLFDRIEYDYKNNEEILKLNELNKAFYSINTFNFAKLNLNIEQRLELIEVLRSNEIALNRMIQIVDNHLEDLYDFDSLMNFLKKKEKKNILNI